MRRLSKVEAQLLLKAMPHSIPAFGSTLSENVAICGDATYDQCGVGFYIIGMHNIFLANRAGGFAIALYTNGGGSGQGPAWWRTCPIHMKFKRFEHNVMHDATKWALYMGNLDVRNPVQDEDGFVNDKSTCGEFDKHGNYNGANPAMVIADSLVYGGGSNGAYFMAGVRFLRLTSIENGASFYWKSSKRMADHGPHIKDSVSSGSMNPSILQVA